MISLINHSHSIDSDELGQVGNEAALSFLFMWVGVLNGRCFLWLTSILLYSNIAV